MTEVRATAASASQLGGPPPITAQTVSELRDIIARYPHSRSALLPMLHLLQSVQGHVTPEGIETCAALLGLSTADVSGVATFYTMYKRRPVGDYHVGVCTNTLCAVMGGDLIFERLKSHLGVGNDETTDDGKITLEQVECNAACDYAPVVMVNWEFFDNQTPGSAVDLVEDLVAGNDVRATRGARICTWREAERVLAGFTDGRAGEGPAAGPASLAGLQLARERNWQAPKAAQSSANGHDIGREQTAEAVRDEPDVAVASSPADTRHVDHEDSPSNSDHTDAGNGKNGP